MRKTREQQEAEDLQVHKAQQLAGIAVAKEVALAVFDGAIPVASVLRIQDEFLAWEENGDPAEDQKELVEQLKEARARAIELFGAGVRVEDVLELHQFLVADFYDDGEEDDE